MSIQFQPLPTRQVRYLRQTRRDIHDQVIVALTSEGEGTPVAFVDIRSAPNNCFLCRVVREG